MVELLNLIKDLTPGAALIVVILYLGTQQIALMRQVQTDNAGFSNKLLEQYVKLDTAITNLESSVSKRNEMIDRQNDLTEKQTLVFQKLLEELQNNGKIGI